MSIYQGGNLMPRVAKDDINLVENKKTANSKKTTAKSTSSKPGTKKAQSTKVSESTKLAKASTSKKSTNSTKTKNNNKKTASSAKTKNSKKTTGSTRTTKNSKSTTKTNKSKKVEILEYYDLPYNYNSTTVKILAQTPTTLFVYWDISNADKENYIKNYGEFFFNDTKPVLIVHNETKNYSFEVDINDFANSWYLHVEDSNCDYRVELGRRPINNYAKINDYLYITESNDLQSPNDHILFDTLSNNVYFKNVKTNITTKKDISLSFLTKLGKLYNAKDFYRNLYKDENIDFDKLNLKSMPSS